jgi:RND family efflux transporter MFP subunit
VFPDQDPEESSVEEEQVSEAQQRRGLARAALWAVPAVGSVLLALLLGPGLIGLQRDEPRPASPRSPSHAVELPSPEPYTNDFGAVDPLEVEALEPDLDYYAEDSPPAALGDELRDAERVIPQLSEAASNALDCLIEPHRVVAVGSPVRGVIERLRVDRSDLVVKGQVLAQLESEVERAAMAAASERAQMTGEVASRKAAYRLRARKEKRAEQLFESESLSLDVREEAQTEAEVARHQLRQAREAKSLAALELKQAIEILRRRTIRSPIDGVVLERLMSPGELVDDEPILRIAQIDPLRVEVILPAARFGTIKPGTRATIIPEFPGEAVHVASVGIVDRVIDAASGTFGVQLELPNPDHQIPGGMRCQVRFLAE